MPETTEYTIFAAGRRGRITAEMNGEPILVLGGTEVPIHLSDESYPFRQDPSFFYLTGVEAPGYAALLDAGGVAFELFIPRVDAKYRVWMGHVPEPATAKSLYGADRVSYFDELPGRLEAALEKCARLHVAATSNPAATALLEDLRRKLPKLGIEIGAVDEHLNEMRLRKEADEIEWMRRAQEVTREAFFALWEQTRPGGSEREVHATIEEVFRRRGALTAYYPIVASGTNPAVLHYHENDRTMNAGDFLLVDAGAEYRGYKSDVTRTVPVDGRWEGERKEIYSIVLEAQKKAVGRVRPDVEFVDLHLSCARDMLEGLRHLGVVCGDLDGLMERHVWQVFFPHGLGHSLGLDTHDVAGHAKGRILPAELAAVNLRTNRPLEPGMVVTIEPGLYFHPLLLERSRREDQLRGAVDAARADRYLAVGGVRIEDDVLVTATGCDVLSAGIPKEMDAIPVPINGA